MALYLTVTIMALFSFVIGVTLGTRKRDVDSIGELVIASDGEGGTYIFLQLEPDKTPTDLHSGSKITLEVRDISTSYNGNKRLLLKKGE